MIEAVSFALGDVVTFKEHCKDRCSTYKGRYYITDCSYSRYAVNGCAWYDKKDLLLLHRATESSFENAYNASHEEEA